MLQVTPITMLNSDYEEKHHCQIAVNDKFMCYGLKQGHVRVLCRNAADRELCKGHTSPLTDMRCAVVACYCARLRPANSFQNLSARRLDLL